MDRRDVRPEDLILKGRELEEFRAVCAGVRSRTLEQHLDNSLGIRTYRPVYDDHDGPGCRSFDSMAAYRQWCRDSVPVWLGFWPAPAEWGPPGQQSDQSETLPDDYPR